MRYPRGLVEYGLLVLQGRPRRRDPAVPASGRRWPSRVAFTSAAPAPSHTAAGTAGGVHLAGTACGGRQSSSPPCFFFTPALPRPRRKPNLPIGFAASKSPAPRQQRGVAS